MAFQGFDAKPAVLITKWWSAARARTPSMHAAALASSNSAPEFLAASIAESSRVTAAERPRSPEGDTKGRLDSTLRRLLAMATPEGRGFGARELLRGNLSFHV
jgi:hypothetical protein